MPIVGLDVLGRTVPRVSDAGGEASIVGSFFSRGTVPLISPTVSDPTYPDCTQDVRLPDASIPIRCHWLRGAFTSVSPVLATEATYSPDFPHLRSPRALRVSGRT